jgi:hypothetical protein
MCNLFILTNSEGLSATGILHGKLPATLGASQIGANIEGGLKAALDWDKKLMNTEEALRRVRLITPMLRDEVRTAILSHAILEAANDTIPKGLGGVHTEYAPTFNAVQNALALKLALELARIFDLSASRGPPEEQDKASIPVLAALVERPDVQADLKRDAEENWFPGVSHIDTAGAEQPAATVYRSRRAGQ